MNARQKVKRLKKELHDLNDAYKTLQSINRYLRWEKLNRGDIAPIKFKIKVPYFYGRENTEEIYKRQLAKEISNFLVGNDLVAVEWEDNNVEQARVYTGILKVVRE